MHLQWLRRVMDHQAIWRGPQTRRFKAWHRECPNLLRNAKVVRPGQVSCAIIKYIMSVASPRRVCLSVRSDGLTFASGTRDGLNDIELGLCPNVRDAALPTPVKFTKTSASTKDGKKFDQDWENSC